MKSIEISHICSAQHVLFEKFKLILEYMYVYIRKT
jgi:hypothetical protein